MHYVAQPIGRSKKFLIRYEQDVDDASYNIMAINKVFCQIVAVLYFRPDDAGCTHQIKLVGALTSREQAQLQTCLCLGLKGNKPKNAIIPQGK